jgi:uncharacterized membrane protein
MGYRVERLREGISSHTNANRPFESVPPPLVGKQFTQVVAFRAAPVALEFLSAGKLYVLVGTDWEGHRAALDWLVTAGFREPLPPARTRGDASFEVWSLLGARGEEVVIPTQVMLVADELRRAS